MDINPTATKPRVVLLGGPDLCARLPLMRSLRDRFLLHAISAGEEARPALLREGFGCSVLPLPRGISPLSDLRAATRLGALLRRLGPDIVHAFDTKPVAYGCLAARSAKVPVVLGTVTGLGSLYAKDDLGTRLLRGAFEALQRRAAAAADALVFQNGDDRRRWIRSGIVAAPKARLILGSGVDCAHWRCDDDAAAARARLRRQLGVHDGHVVVTMVARLLRTKGVLEFARAAQALRAAAPDARLFLVGPDDRHSRDRLSPEERREVEASVRWLGPREDVRAIYAASDVAALPTAYREGIPRALLEAAAMGLPLVTTDAPGCNEACRDGENGRLFAVGDQPAFVAALAELCRSAPLRMAMGARSRLLAETRFDLRVVAEQTATLWNTLLTERCAARSSKTA